MVEAAPKDARKAGDSIVEDILTVLLHSADRRPADPEATAALARLASARRDILRARGVKDADITNPHGHNPAEQKKGGE